MSAPVDPRQNRQNHNQRNTSGARFNPQNPQGRPEPPIPEVVNWIKDLKLTTKTANLTCICLGVTNAIRTTDGNEVRNIIISDKTGRVNLSMWGELGGLVREGDILKIQRAYTKLFKDVLTLYISKQGSIQRVGDFCLQFNDKNDLSDPKITWESGDSRQFKRSTSVQ